MNILLISFYKNDNMMYPHLQEVLNVLKENHDADYFQFRERGYSIFGNKSIKQYLHVLKTILIDFNKLKKQIKSKQYDKIIVIDHFAYWITSLIAPINKIIFWSFDIMGDDSTYYKHFIVRFILRKNAMLLSKNGKMIIQNEERLKLLERTLKLNIPRENVLFMPVFIKPAPFEIKHTPKNTPPILMQATSFDGQRYTDELIAQYQEDNSYELMLHGLNWMNLHKKLSALEKKPNFSDELVEPSELYNIIKTCDIGFLGLKLVEDNCKYLYGASNQLIEFLRLGKPVISIGANNIGAILKKNNAGIEIFSINELQNAVIKISLNYEVYSKNALELFKKDFNNIKISNDFLNYLK